MTSSWDAAQVARDWWEYQRLWRGSREERKALAMGVPEEAQAAHDFVDQMIERGSREAVELLAVLTEATPTGN